jgi:hypothetical protein
MNSFPRVLLFGAVVVAAFSVPFVRPAPNSLMLTKTKHAQEILRFLAQGNLQQVAKEAEALEMVTTEAGFDGKSDLYAAYGDEFLNQVRGLKKMANEKNTAGSYYYFTRITGVCFSCHEHVRKAE